jgi:ribonuclease-3
VPPRPTAILDPGNAKGELIAACRNQGLPDPSFQNESGGPGHAPWFRTVVLLGAHELGSGEGRSKRDAERAASLEALKAIAVPAAKQPVPSHEAVQTPAETAARRWPIYADVLKEALLVAHERNEDGLLSQVARDAAELYRHLLGELGYSLETP